VQSLTNPNGSQPPGGNNKKGRNNPKDGKNGNKSKDNNEKMGNSVGEGKREKCKAKFPCKISTDDHLTHLCPKLVEAVVNSQNETVLSAEFWVDIIAFSSIFKSFLSFYS
jgi:hypothetical protein